MFHGPSKRMRAFLAHRWLFGALAAPALLASCLPEDTRPPPGTLVVTVSTDDSLSPERMPFTTEDGWDVVYERFLLEVGNTSFDEEDEACNDYQGGFGSHYGRLLDMQVKKKQRLSEMRFLGTCRFGFESTTPEYDDVLGENVTDEDKFAMRLPADDAYTQERGTSLRAIGSARKGDQVKHFDWSFRQGLLFKNCRIEGESSGIRLSGDESKTIDILVRGTALFQETLEGTALRFDAFAEADDVYGDADGTVTFEEMAEVPVDSETLAGWRSARDVSDVKTLADFVYLGLFPEVFRYSDGGICDLDEAFDAKERDD